jgi:hypothetical protein
MVKKGIFTLCPYADIFINKIALINSERGRIMTWWTCGKVSVDEGYKERNWAVLNHAGGIAGEPIHVKQHKSCFGNLAEVILIVNLLFDITRRWNGYFVYIY